MLRPRANYSPCRSALSLAKYALLLTVALLWVGRAAAATVAIVQPLGDTEELREAAFRIQGELVAVGLAVALAERPPAEDTRSTEARAWFERTAEARGLDAFIDIVGEDALVGVDVWLWDRSTKRLTVSRVSLAPGVPNAAATAAIRAIEVLRSSFLVFDSAGPPPKRPEKVTAEPEDDRTARRTHGTPNRIGIAAGAATLTSLDGVGPAVIPLAQFEWLLGSGLALHATGAGFGTRPEVASDDGSAELAQQFVLLGLCACSAEPGLRPMLAFSAGLLHTALEGRAELPNIAHRVDRWSSLFEASAGARLNWAHRYQLALAAHLQLAEPYVRVRIVDTVVATSGRPNLMFSFTLGAWL
jgi:hypothetical protein